MHNLHSKRRSRSAKSRVVPWLARIAYFLFRYLIVPFYFGKIEVRGQKYLPKEGPVILAPTHRSRWDAIIIPYAAGRDIIGRDLRFMVWADEMKGLQGWFIRRLGGFPINPRQPESSSLRHGIKLLEEGEVLVIFPEGNIFRTEEVQPLEPGLTRLALQAQSNQASLDIQVVPISIYYSQPIPHWGCMQVSDYCKKPAKQCAAQLKTDLAMALQELHEGRVPDTDS